MRKLWQFYCPDGPKFLIQVTSGSAQKFVWGSMVDFQKTTCISGPAQSVIARCSEYVHLDVMTLFWALHNSYDQQTEVITVGLRKINGSPYKFKKNRPVKKWKIWGTFGPKFPVFFTSLWPSQGLAGVPIGPLWPLFASRTHQDP